MGGDLQDRVRRGVEDQFTGPQVVLAVLVEHSGPTEGPVAAEALPRRLLERRHHTGREALGVGGQRPFDPDAHELPVPGGGLLAGPHGADPAVQNRRRRRRHALNRDDRAEPQRPHDGQLQTPGQLGEMRERVGPLVAIRGRVGQGAHSTGVHDDDSGASHVEWISVGR